MDFVQYLEKLSELDQHGISEMPDYKDVKVNIANIMNDIIIETQLIPDKYKRKKAQRKLSIMTDCIDEIFKNLDELYEKAVDVKTEDEWKEHSKLYCERIKRQLELCNDAQKELTKILE